MADLPGLKLENYVSEFLESSVEVLKGRVNLEVEYIEEEKSAKNESLVKKVTKKRNYTLEVGDKMNVSFS